MPFLAASTPAAWVAVAMKTRPAMRLKAPVAEVFMDITPRDFIGRAFARLWHSYVQTTKFVPGAAEILARVMVVEAGGYWSSPRSRLAHSVMGPRRLGRTSLGGLTKWTASPLLQPVVPSVMAMFVIVIAVIMAGADTNADSDDRCNDDRRNRSYVIVGIPESPPRSRIPPACVVIVIASVLIFIPVTVPGAFIGS